MKAENVQTDLSLPARINLYYDLFVPEAAETPAPLLIAVHGYGAHKRHMMREARLIAPESFVVASIQAPHQHFREADGVYKPGFGWLTDFRPEESIRLHHGFLLDLIEKLAGEKLIDEKRIFLYGFSQACALNFRFAFTHPRIPRGVLGVCGGIPGDLDANEIYHPTDAEVFYLYSRRDEFYSLEKFEKFADKLNEFLPNFRAESYDAAHEITEEMRVDMRAWLAHWK